MSKNSEMKKVEEIYPIRRDLQDDLFITCGSFEERFIGTIRKLRGDFPRHFVLFRFSGPNMQRDKLVKEMEETIDVDKHQGSYHLVPVEYGKSIESVLGLHDFLSESKLPSEELHATVDISTFTKDLLLNLILYLSDFLQVKTLRLLYTTPARYASPQEGWLSYGIKSAHIPPMCWNGWSPLKYNLLIIMLGFEEMRAWSLIDKFSSDLNWLFVTNPGSKSEWNTYCEEYNSRLLSEIPAKDNIPALDPVKVSEILSDHVTMEIAEKYNIFVSPLGPKPQLIGTLHFISHSHIPINIVTTTAVNYNVPYYSRGLGDSFEFFYPLTEAVDDE